MVPVDPDPDPQHCYLGYAGSDPQQRISVFLTQKIVTRLMEIQYDPEC